MEEEEASHRPEEESRPVARADHPVAGLEVTQGRRQEGQEAGRQEGQEVGRQEGREDGRPEDRAEGRRTEDRLAGREVGRR